MKIKIRNKVLFGIIKYVVVIIFLILFLVDPLTYNRRISLYYLGLVVFLNLVRLIVPKLDKLILVVILVIIIFLCFNYFVPCCI